MKKLYIISLLLLLTINSPNLKAETVNRDSIATELENQASTIQFLGMFVSQDSALVLSELALNKSIRFLGTLDSTTAFYYGLLGAFQLSKGFTYKAVENFKISIDIQDQIHWNNIQQYAHVLSPLATGLLIIGRLIEAEETARRSIKIRKQLNDSDQVAVGEFYLGVIFMETGRIGEAKSLMEAAIKIISSSKNPTVNQIANYGFNELSKLYVKLGLLDEAEKSALLMNKIEISPTNYLSLSAIVANKGELNKAINYIHQAIDLILQSNKSSATRELAEAYINLGTLLQFQQNYTTAIETYALAQQILNVENPDLEIRLYIGLANAELSLGNLHKSKEYFDSTFKLIDAQPNINLYARTTALLSYSEFAKQSNDWDLSIKLVQEAYQIRKTNFNKNSDYFDEQTALAFSQYMKSAVDRYLSLLSECPNVSQQMATFACILVLESKGAVSNIVFTRHQNSFFEADSVQSNISRQSAIVKEEISRMLLNPSKYKEDKYFIIVLDSLRNHAKELELQLINYSTKSIALNARQDIKLAEVQKLIPKSAIMLEFVKYNTQLLLNSKLNNINEYQYAITILSHSNKPKIINIGKAKTIDSLVAAYRNNILQVFNDGTTVSFSRMEEYRAISSKLYTLIWEPINDQVSDKDLVIVIPDSDLNLIAFSGLMSDSNRYLIEDYTIHYLSSGRDLLHIKKFVLKNDGLLAIGDPDFNAIPISQVLHRNISSFSPAQLYRSGCTSLLDLNAVPLPGTLDEIKEIIKMWDESHNKPALSLTGAKASEYNFKKLAPSKRILHIATHGFFLGSECLNNFKTNNPFVSNFVQENPLLLSGILLAGANRKNKDLEGEQSEDGILTAFEVASLNLSNTEIVTLSACESAAGKILDGEGVYGLRRAFQLAGVRTIISSLWQVADEATADFMSHLYQVKHSSIPRQLRKLTLDRLNKIRSLKKYDHPANWGAFTSTGGW